MDKLPMHDVPMLVSSINYLIRDRFYENLDDICAGFGVSRSEIEEKLATMGFEYSEELNKVW